MKTEQLAIGMALAALAFVAVAARKSGATVAAISPQPAQRERDYWLSNFLRDSNAQFTLTESNPMYAHLANLQP